MQTHKTWRERLFLAVNDLGSSSHNPHPNPLPSPAKGEGISSPRLRGEDQGEGPLIEPVTATFNHNQIWLVMAMLIATGCALFGGRKPMTLRIHEQADGAVPEGHRREVQIPKTGLTLIVDPFPVLTERDVEVAELYETSGGLAVMLRFDAHGMFVLDEVTTRDRDRYLVVFLNDRPVTARLVDQRLVHGQFLLEGDFTDAEARQLIDDLNRMAKKRG